MSCQLLVVDCFFANYQSPNSPMTNDHRRLKHRDSPKSQTKKRKRRVIAQNPQLLPKSPFRKSMTPLAASATLLVAAGLIVGGAGLGIQLIVNPDAATWINQFLPEWTRIPIASQESAQTLAQIRARINQKGLIPGEILLLKSRESITDLLILPVLAQRSNCQADCRQIVELRVYQLLEPTETKDKDKYYRLMSQAQISGPEESAVMTSLNHTESENHQSSRKLPLTQLHRLEGNVPESGVWLNLSGKVQGNAPVTYGQVFHYNPTTTHLSLMLPLWTSPIGRTPYWQGIGGDSPELVVDQKVGLEPYFRVYQLKQRLFLPDPIYLEEISLAEPALNNQEYRNVLILAKSGLWTTALELLQSLKAKEWSDSAQAQMDLIHLHAQVTQSQAKKHWASPHEQVLVDLIDGRWQDGLKAFQLSEFAQRFEIINMLKADSTHLWRRVEAAIKVNPTQSDVQAWGALIVAAKEGRAKAIAWLQQQPQKTLSTITWINQLLDQMDAPLTAALPVGNHTSQIIGTAKLVEWVNAADWLQPQASSNSSTPSLQKSEQQVWYQVQVTTFNDGQVWRRQPFADLTLLTATQASQLWQLLGLETDSQMKISLWKPNGRKETVLVTVKAAQLKNGVLQLLASGKVPPSISQASLKSQGGLIPPLHNSKLSESHFLAYSEKALQWLEPNSINLVDLYQTQPQWATIILPTLWSELQTTHIQPPGPIPSLQVILRSIGNLPIQTIDLTSNNLPEAVLTIYPDMALSSRKSGAKASTKSGLMFRHRTMIFSDTGALIYSEFTNNTGQSLVAIADMGDGGPPTLVFQSATTYTMKRWSIERQRFD